MICLGIDPGRSGAIACLGIGDPYVISLDQDEREIARALDSFLPTGSKPVAALEKVHAMPGQGVTSTFKFGASYGAMRMLLACLIIPYIEVTPSKWQGDLGCRSKGNKNITKHRAQEMYPGVKVTHRNADALLLAEYARLYWRDK